MPPRPSRCPRRRARPPHRRTCPAATTPQALAALCLLAATAGLGGCGGTETPGPDHEEGAERLRPTDAPNSSGDSIVFSDAAGRRHALARPARRIVSLVPSATETIHAIGADARLVGVTDYDLWPWADTLPSVGGGLDPNLEALIALRPDVVVRFEGEQDPRTPTRLDELGIRHVAVRPVSLDDVYETNRIVGALTGRREAADSLTRKIRQGLTDLSESVSSLPRKRVAFMLGGSPPWVSGPGTYVSDILGIVGGDNVFADLGRPYAPVSPEELRSREIDVVLVSRAGTYDAALTPDARIEVVGDALDAPGPDVVAGARSVAQAIHGPEAIPGRDLR